MKRLICLVLITLSTAAAAPGQEAGAPHQKNRDRDQARDRDKERTRDDHRRKKSWHDRHRGRTPDLDEEKIALIKQYIAEHWADHWNPYRRRTAQMIARMNRENPRACRYMIRKVAHRVLEEKKLRESDPKMFALRDTHEKTGFRLYALRRKMQSPDADRKALMAELKKLIALNLETKIKMQQMQVQLMRARIDQLRQEGRPIDPERLKAFENRIAELEKHIQQMLANRQELIDKQVAAWTQPRRPHPKRGPRSEGPESGPPAGTPLAKPPKTR